MNHLCVLYPDAWQKMLSGEKKIESRLAVDRRPPWKQVAPGDVIYCKHQGKVYGKFTAGNIFHEQGEGVVDLVVHEYGHDIAAPREWWQRKANARFATLIEVVNPQKLPEPFFLTQPRYSRVSWLSPFMREC